MRRSWPPGAPGPRRSWPGGACCCIPPRRSWPRRRNRRRSSGSSCGPAAGAGCPRATSGVSATACGDCANAGGRGPSAGGRWSSGGRLGGARGARRHVASAPRDLPGRVVRAARAAGPGGLTGPQPPRGSRRLLEQQCRERRPRRAQQEPRRQPERQQRFSCGEHAPPPEPARPRPRRERTGASRAGHDESAPLKESGGVTAGARPGPRGRRAPVAVFRAAAFLDGFRSFAFSVGSHNPRLALTRPLHSGG